MEPSREQVARLADEIMREDWDILRGLADADKQMEVAREVMERRREALAKLAKSDDS